MSHQVLLILASVGYWFYLSSIKITDVKYSAGSYTALRSLTDSILHSPSFIHPHISVYPLYWLIVIISVSVYGLSVFCSFKAYQKTDASIVNIIHKISVVISAILGILFLVNSTRFFSIFWIIPHRRKRNAPCV